MTTAYPGSPGSNPKSSFLRPCVDYLIHPSFGDLRNRRSVCIDGPGEAAFPEEKQPLYIHLTVTMKCNARCNGCINSCITFKDKQTPDSDAKPERDAAAILHLIKKDRADEVVVCFYGGEPLLAPGIIRDTIRILQRDRPRGCRIRYMIYTNGISVKQAVDYDALFTEDIWLYSFSIDGGRQQHDRYRVGTSFDRIVESLEYLTRKNATPQKLMWTTLREGQSLADAFAAYMSLQRDSLVNHFFWHFVETDKPFQALPTFAADYEQDLRHILESYMYELREHHRLLSILHLNELILYLLCGKHRGSSACGVELAGNYDIVAGSIQTCADLPPEYTAGRINGDGSVDTLDQDLSHLVAYKDDLGCKGCGIHPYCGGRCPVQALTGSRERLRQYCQLMRLHVGVVAEYLPEIRTALDRANVSLQDLYDRSAYYVQFTDVTP
jgi:radical SAM protein with 4Fe4S-binding SPASM domain